MPELPLLDDELLDDELVLPLLDDELLVLPSHIESDVAPHAPLLFAHTPSTHAAASQESPLLAQEQHDGSQSA